MRLREAPPKVLKLLHPKYRDFVQRKGRRSKPKVKRSIIKKILWRCIHYAPPLPRISTYYCEICHFGTSVMKFIKMHKCPENKEKLRNYPQESELRAVLSGSKCKTKDSTAVMERCPYPQKMPKIYCPTVDQDVVEKETVPMKTYSVPKLSDICLNILSPNENRMTDCYMEILPSTSENACNSSLSSVGYICNECKKLSGSYEEYDDHLAAGDCRPKSPNPIPIMAHNSVIPEYGYGRCRLRFASEVPCETFDLQKEVKPEENGDQNGVSAKKRRRNHQICTGCEKNDWTSTTEFHEHIMECGRSMYSRLNLMQATKTA